MTENDAECLKFMDLSILKDDKYEGAHFIKASTLNYMGKYDEAVKHFKLAITLKADRAEFHSGLGDRVNISGKGKLYMKGEIFLGS